MYNYVNMQEGLDRIRGNEKLYKMLLGSYIKGDYVNKLSEQLLAGNLSDATVSAHTIKGAAANLSLNVLAAAAKDLEMALKAGADYQKEYDALKTADAATIEEINTILAE